MVRAAKSFSFGRGEHLEDGQPINHKFAQGDEIPDDIASEIPPELILENLATESPEELTRGQLMILANLTEHSTDEPIEYDESDLRDALENLRSKPDVLDWFNQIRPGQDRITDVDIHTRAEMVDLIVEELTGE